VSRTELLARVERCPLCEVKALENPTTVAESITGMREHIRLIHGDAMVAMFNRLTEKQFPGAGL